MSSNSSAKHSSDYGPLRVLATTNGTRSRNQTCLPTAASQDPGYVKDFPQYNRLPLEIRLSIINHYMDAEFKTRPLQFVYDCGQCDASGLKVNPFSIVSLQYCSCPNFWLSRKKLPRICLASKQLYSEATPVFIGRCQWLLQGRNAAAKLSLFLDPLTDNDGKMIGHNYIRDLEFISNVIVCPVSEDTKFLLDRQLSSRCPALNTITFTFRLFSCPAYLVTCIAEVKRNIVAAYSLEEIFKCRNLERFCLTVEYRSWQLRCSKGNVHELKNYLVTWVRDGVRQHCKRQAKVDVWHSNWSRVELTVLLGSKALVKDATGRSKLFFPTWE